MLIKHHVIISYINNLLQEGFKDDQAQLVSDHPDHKQTILQLGPKYINWLIARFGPDSKIKETHPFNDAIVTIASLSKKDAGIGQKYA